jgi:hypothetical protein
MVDTSKISGPVHGKIVAKASVPSAATAPTVPLATPSLLTKLEELIEKVEAQAKADEAKAKNVFEKYWPALAGLIVGIGIGFALTHVL